MDKFADGSQVGVCEGPIFYLRLGGDLSGDEALGFVQVAAQAFVAGEAVADAGEAGRRLGGAFTEQGYGFGQSAGY